MTTPMRERLCVVLAEHNGDVEAIVGVKPGTPEFVAAALEHCGGAVDAILAELETPDDEMIEVGRYSGPITGAKVLENAFTAMIRAVRGK